MIKRTLTLSCSLSLLLAVGCGEEEVLAPTPTHGPFFPAHAPAAVTLSPSAARLDARPPLLRFPGAARYTTTIATGDAADVHYPTDHTGALPRSGGKRYAAVVVLQGAQTEKSNYAKYAAWIARYGFVVIVPNRLRTLPPIPAPTYLTEQRVVTDGFARLVQDGADPASPLYGAVDASRLGLTGHSFGGVMALLAIEGGCAAPFCTAGTYERPQALKGAALYGTNYTAGSPRMVVPVDTSAVPVALIQGTQDGRALPEYGIGTYGILAAPKAYVEVVGANHFGITDTDSPAGTVPDPNPSTIAGADAVERIASWSAAFLRATVYDDSQARAQLFDSDGTQDGTVRVIAVPAPAGRGQHAALVRHK